MEVKIAICQRPPVLLDKGASLAAALTRVEEAPATGAGLIIFPEAFVPGYPTWIWRLRPGGDMTVPPTNQNRTSEESLTLVACYLGRGSPRLAPTVLSFGPRASTRW